jgi:hypothetical protein
MTIHPNAPPKAEIDDPEKYLHALLNAYPRSRKKAAEYKVLKRFPLWNRWKPSWRPDGLTKTFNEAQGNKHRPSDHGGTSLYKERWEEVRRQRKHREEQQRQEQARMNQQHSASGATAESIEAIFAESDKVVMEWTSSAADYADLHIREDHTAEDVVQILAAALSRLKDERDRAISIVSTLMMERTRARAYMAARASPGGQSNPLYRKVGLDEQCPNHVLAAVRKSFRRVLHPDSHPSHKRSEAERIYKETEAIFDKIYTIRKL